MGSTCSPPMSLHGALVDIHSTFGVIYICATAAIGLLGITTLQAWFYFRSYPNDSKYLKLLVVIVWCLEFLRSVFVVHVSYFYVVSNWGNPMALNVIVWSVSTVPLMTHIVEFIVQLFFVWRIWTLSQGGLLGWILSSSVSVLAIWNFGMGITINVLVEVASGWDSYTSGAQKILEPLSLSTSMATNIAIMVSLTYILHKGRSELQKTNQIINTIIFYTIQAGALIVLVDIIVIVLHSYIGRTGFAYIGLYATLGNLYANSLLASLNARVSLRRTGSSTPSVTVPNHWNTNFKVPCTPKVHKNQVRTANCATEDGTGRDLEAYKLQILSSSSSHASGVQDDEPKVVSLGQRENGTEFC